MSDRWTDQARYQDFHVIIEHGTPPMLAVGYKRQVPANPLLFRDGFCFPAFTRVAAGAWLCLIHARLSSLSITAEQAISYSAILTGEHCVVADQTGSGKTLAYLAPLVQRLRCGVVCGAGCVLL